MQQTLKSLIEHQLFCLSYLREIYSFLGEKDRMIKVKLFDQEHEKDLELEMNKFLAKIEEKKLIDIKYNVAAITEEEDEQIYCFSSMIIYKS